MKTILILMDSVNRRHLRCYGGDFVHTPNIDRLAARGVVFDNHYSGSLPCIPARRELMTGRHNFLEAPWGPIEPWDRCVPQTLSAAGVYTHMVTDHYHYFHSGGEGYHNLFDSYEFLRGQENDRWRPLVERPQPPAGARGKALRSAAYWSNRRFMDPEDDLAYSTPRTFQQAIDFIEHNHQADDWHLHIEAFDPHEPFDCPTRYHAEYGDDWSDYLYTWPEYAKLDPERDDQRAIAHIRKSYAATLTMADAWLGKFLDSLDRHGLWDDCRIIFTTDHGFLLGEHGYWAKNYMFDYNYLAHIPLIACVPGVAPGSSAALTTTVDIAPTLLEMHGVATDAKAATVAGSGAGAGAGAAEAAPMHGRSLLSALAAKAGATHAATIFGYFAKNVNVTDGHYTYCREPHLDLPAYHYTAMPRGFSDFIPVERLAAAEYGVFLPSARGVPHLRLPVASYRHLDSVGHHLLFDVQNDPEQRHPFEDRTIERRMVELLRARLEAVEAPACQFARLGLS